MTLTIFEIKDIQVSKSNIVSETHNEAIYNYTIGELGEPAEKLYKHDHFSYQRLKSLMKYGRVVNPKDLIGWTFFVDEFFGGPFTNFQKLLDKAASGKIADDEAYHWQIYHRMIQRFANGKVDVNLSMFSKQKISEAIRTLIGDDELIWLKVSDKLGKYSDGKVDINRSQQSRKRPTKSTVFLMYHGDLMIIQISIRSPFFALLY